MPKFQFISLLIVILTINNSYAQDNIDSSIVKTDIDSTISVQTDSTLNSINPLANSIPTKKKDGKVNDSSSVVDTNIVVFGWILDDDFLNPIKSDIDTSIFGFHVDNKVLKKYPSLSFLGGNGNAYLSNNFFDRKSYEGPLFLNTYKGYFQRYDNTLYLNTKKPFTHLKYTNGRSTNDKEESIQIQHSQNVTEKLNFGFDFGVLSSKGQYLYLTSKNINFKTFTSYKGEKYKLHATYNLNRYTSYENGGINDSIFLSETLEPIVYGTNFLGEESSPYEAYVSTRIRYYDGMLSQRLKLFSLGNNSADSLGSPSTVAEPILSHVFQIRRVSKSYEETSDNEPNFPIYRNFYSNTDETYDSITEFRVSNKIQLDFKTKLKNKVLAGIYGSLNHDYINYSFYSLLDSTLIGLSEEEKADLDTIYGYSTYRNSAGDTIYDINRKKNLSNLYITAGLYGKFRTQLEGNFSGKIYLAGYKAGQTELRGSILTNAKILNKPYQLNVAGTIENIVPSYHLNNYYSNNYMWEQSLNSVNKVSLSGNLNAPSNKFELSGEYALLRNHIYLTDSLPVNYSKPLSLFTVGLEKEFKFLNFHSELISGSFHFYNKLIYQVSENESVVEVPDLIVYNSTYLDLNWNFNLTGGALQTVIGFDVRYNTAFNGYNYLPALGMFYQDSEQTKIGNYPIIDLWLNVYLKRTRFFFKYEHFNSSWDRKDYYNAVSYPAYEKYFKFGLSWTFYN